VAVAPGTGRAIAATAAASTANALVNVMILVSSNLDLRAWRGTAAVWLAAPSAIPGT
jgi:hypothetical protein